MKRPGVFVLVVCLVAVAAGLTWRNAKSRSKPEGVERGAYLVTALGCNDCHTPFTMTERGPAPDMTRMLSGHPAGTALGAPPALGDGWMWAGSATNTAFAGPWGITYAPNLTPHMTGLGVYTEETFIAALRTGKQMGVGRPVMPPMPWQGYGQLDDQDLSAIYAYLQTVPPIENVVPAYRPPLASTATID